MARAVELIQDHGGRRHPDESAALRWRTAFIRMPYARELTVPLGVINDTFESAVTWDRFEAFHAAVRAATEEALEEATGRPGTVSTRFTHVYPDGPAPYYTFNARGTPGRLLEQWRHVKARASDALLAAGARSPTTTRLGATTAWYRERGPPCSARSSTRPRACARSGEDSQQGVLCREGAEQGLGGRSPEGAKKVAMALPARCRSRCSGPGADNDLPRYVAHPTHGPYASASTGTGQLRAATPWSSSSGPPTSPERVASSTAACDGPMPARAAVAGCLGVGEERVRRVTRSPPCCPTAPP